MYYFNDIAHLRSTRIPNGGDSLSISCEEKTEVKN